MKNYVEQTVHAFLEQHKRRKSQCKMKWGANRGHQSDSIRIA